MREKRPQHSFFGSSRQIPVWDPSKESWTWRTPAPLQEPPPGSPTSEVPKNFCPDLHRSGIRGPGSARSKRTLDAGAAHIATQTSASLEGTGTKIKIPFDLSVVNNSLCIRLEDNGTNTNCRVQRHSRRGSWGAGEGVVEKPFGFRALGAGETEGQPRQRKRFPQGGMARSAMMLTRPAGGHVRRTQGHTQTSLLGARVFAFSFNIF